MEHLECKVGDMHVRVLWTSINSKLDLWDTVSLGRSAGLSICRSSTAYCESSFLSHRSQRECRRVPWPNCYECTALLLGKIYTYPSPPCQQPTIDQWWSCTRASSKQHLLVFLSEQVLFLKDSSFLCLILACEEGEFYIIETLEVNFKHLHWRNVDMFSYG